ncbi:MAG: methyltransferase domain-containing protein [Phycisphaerales bacterium]|nr:methyltransferase domain-containing protein [Phycisphaerales bacterium]
MPSARDIALFHLRRWTNLSDPPLLPERSSELALSPRDRAFFVDLLNGIIRWRGALDAVIASRLRQPLDSLQQNVRALLWLGAYQLLFQRGTTDYAAVDTTVSLAKKHQETVKSAGLVNAVLRGITRLQPTVTPRTNATLSRRSFALDFTSQLTFNENIFLDPQSNPIGHLAQVRSHPIPYVEHLRNIYGQSQAGELLLRNNLRPVITLRSDSADQFEPRPLGNDRPHCQVAARSLPDGRVSEGLIPHEIPGFFVASKGWNPAIEALVQRGPLSPQDPTAAKPVRTFAAGQFPVPSSILDLCAGMGTKTIQLAAAFPEARITAADTNPLVLGLLEIRAKNLGMKNITTRSAQSLIPPTDERYDLILADVPCSNTGVFAKRVQSRWRWPTLDRSALAQLQTKLLTQSVHLLASGGTLLYSTCSIDSAENSDLIKMFLASCTIPLTLIQELLTLPSLTSAATAMRDGGYFAILRR